MVSTYTVEVHNVGKRPIPGVPPTSVTFQDPDQARDALHRTVGELVLQPGLVVVGAEARGDPSGGGVLAAARFTAEDGGGRVEVILRRRPADPSSSPGGADDDA